LYDSAEHKKVPKETVAKSRHYAAYNEILMIMIRTNGQLMGHGIF
jgi:hypothetical protein